MGLRLVTPDGRRITRLSRWVLRCAACFLVTKEMGRLFCPRCGNAALDKVQVRGPAGAPRARGSGQGVRLAGMRARPRGLAWLEWDGGEGERAGCALQAAA